MARKKSGLGAFAGGLLAGAAFGTAAGLLFAPRSGRETRRVIKKSVKKSVNALPEIAEGAASTAQAQAGKISAAAAERLVETLEQLRVAASAGIAASQAIAQASDNPSAESEDSEWDDGEWADRSRRSQRANKRATIRYTRSSTDVLPSNGALNGKSIATKKLQKR
ncbi:MAG: YtxH domain-containing protein [Cyanobacteria bacterium P01_C01_bin.89]